MAPDHTYKLLLVKAGHQYIFRFVSSRKDEMISELARMAKDSDCALDQIDVARVAYRIGMVVAEALSREVADDWP